MLQPDTICCKVVALVSKYVTLKKEHELGSATSAELEFSLRHTPLVFEKEEKGMSAADVRQGYHYENLS